MIINPLSTNSLSRHELKYRFLTQSLNSSNYTLTPLLADASKRNYFRIVNKDNSYILMDCPVEYCSLKPFIKIAKFLSINGFAAPDIYYIDHQQGFLLLEDFGDISVFKYLMKNLDKHGLVYKSIIEMLVKLQNIAPPNDLPTHNKKLQLSDLSPYIEYYIPYVTGKNVTDIQKDEFLNIWSEILEALPVVNPSIILRDFHVQNMMLLDVDNLNKIGLLDFQDALIGSPIYDLVSLLEDARINVPFDKANELIDHYAYLNPAMSKKDIILSYHILGGQRNSRILGIFARKALQENNKNYLQYIPRVLNYLQNDISHVVFKDLKMWISQNVQLI